MNYKIPVSWQMWGLFEVDADSLEDALDKAESDGTPLPKDAEYISGSFMVEAESVMLHNPAEILGDYDAVLDARMEEKDLA